MVEVSFLLDKNILPGNIYFLSGRNPAYSPDNFS
jgi:hypothetical protein